MTENARMPLHARCDTCQRRDGCQEFGLPHDYPSCHRGIRRTRVDRLSALLRICAESEGLPSDRLDVVVDACLRQHQADRERYSEVFELSVSRVGGINRSFRFSYAFPDFQRNSQPAFELIRALGVAYGPGPAQLLDAGLKAARHPSVVMPLLGLEDAGERFRLKMYLQFHDDAGESALKLAASLLTRPAWEMRFARQRLHLLGIDIGPSGVSGAKLYFDVSPLPLDVPWLRSSGFVEDLLSEGLRELRSALAIHRFASRHDAGSEFPDELDYGLADNELPWSHLRTFPHFASAFPLVLTDLERQFRLGVRRLSFSTANDDKLTAYYVLAESDHLPR